MLRYSEEHGKAESRKDKVVEGWGRSLVRTGWGIGYDGSQGATQKKG